MNYPKVHSAKALDRHTLLIEFDNNEKKLYDVAPLLSREMFAPLKNYSLFRNVQVDPHGYAVFWNEDIDLSEFELWQNGVQIVAKT